MIAAYVRADTGADLKFDSQISPDDIDQELLKHLKKKSYEVGGVAVGLENYIVKSECGICAQANAPSCQTQIDLDLLKLCVQHREIELGLASAYRETLFLRNNSTPQKSAKDHELLSGIPSSNRAWIDTLICFGCDGCIPGDRYAEHVKNCSLEVGRILREEDRMHARLFHFSSWP